MAKNKNKNQAATKPAIRPALPSKVNKAIDNVLNYLWDEERTDALHYYNDNGTLEGHIIIDMMRVDAWKRGADARKELSELIEEFDKIREATEAERRKAPAPAPEA